MARDRALFKRVLAEVAHDVSIHNKDLVAKMAQKRISINRALTGDDFPGLGASRTSAGPGSHRRSMASDVPVSSTPTRTLKFGTAKKSIESFLRFFVRPDSKRVFLKSRQCS